AGAASRAPSRGPARPTDPAVAGTGTLSDGPRPAETEATIRVAAHSVDRALDRLTKLGIAEERIAARATRASEDARKVREMRADLAEALRLIGPPRPWGAPAAALVRIERTAAALARMSESLEAAADDVRATDQEVKEAMRDVKQQLSAMRQTPLKGM